MVKITGRYFPHKSYCELDTLTVFNGCRYTALTIATMRDQQESRFSVFHQEERYGESRVRLYDYFCAGDQAGTPP